MKEITNRIEWLETAIRVLTKWDPSDHNNELNRAIKLAKYRDELEILDSYRMRCWSKGWIV